MFVSGMTDAAFSDLKQTLEGALAFERGARHDLNVMRVQAPVRRKQCHLKTLPVSKKAQLLAVRVRDDPEHVSL